MKWRIELDDSRGPGIGGQRPIVKIRVRSRYGDFTVVPFCIDTGADLTAIPVSLAEDEGIAYPRDEHSRGRSGGLVGAVDRFRGSVHLRLFGEDFTWPCDFVDSPRPTTQRPYGVIGRAGFLAAFHFCIKGDYLTLQRRLDGRPLWQRLLLCLLPAWTRTHPADQPL
jgi:hypothetical protein